MIRFAPLESPAVWPEGTTAPHFAVGSVNIVDCGNQLLDLRNYNVDDPAEDATFVFMNCHILFGDLTHYIASWMWGLDSTAATPCNVRPPSFLHGSILSQVHVSPDVFYVPYMFVCCAL